MAKIFLSYQREREPFVKLLAADLSTLGHTVWFDRELSGGQHWWNQILSSIRECEVFVFVLDPKSLASVPCQREYGYASELGKRILPVLAVAGISPHRLPPELSVIQFVDLRERSAEAILKLASALNALPPPLDPPQPLPAPPDVPLSPLSRLSQQIDSRATLSVEAQSVLLLDLKRSLADPELMDDAAHLLDAMRRRPDLLASIAAEIDALPKSTRAPLPTPPNADAPDDDAEADRQVAGRAFWFVSVVAAIPSLIAVYSDPSPNSTPAPAHAIVGFVTGAGAWLAIVVIGVSRFRIALLVLGASIATSAWLAFGSGSLHVSNVAAAIVFVAPAGAVITAIGHRLFTWWRSLS